MRLLAGYEETISVVDRLISQLVEAVAANRQDRATELVTELAGTWPQVSQTLMRVVQRRDEYVSATQWYEDALKQINGRDPGPSGQIAHQALIEKHKDTPWHIGEPGWANRPAKRITATSDPPTRPPAGG